jgi:hypothetical protein
VPLDRVDQLDIAFVIVVDQVGQQPDGVVDLPQRLVDAIERAEDLMA